MERVPADSDARRIGVSGLGHWATKYDEAMDGDLTFYSAVDVEPIEEKEDELSLLGIPDDRYHQIAPDDPLPESFLQDVDVVQIASPITEHRRQTIQALQDTDALVVTEKAYGPTLDDHEAVQGAAAREPNDTYLHLHYTRKMPTLALRDAVEGEDASIRDVTMSFLEGFRQEDEGRAWIFDPANGGIVLDWIHPIEVLVYACGARFDDLVEGSGVRTTDAYGVDHPTAAELTYDVSGPAFADGATATIRIGKGFPRDVPHKAGRFTMDGQTLDISYASSSVEKETSDRGALTYEGRDAAMDVLDGPDPYTLMVEDMGRVLEGGEPPFTLEEGREMMKGVQLANDHLFSDDATTLTTDAAVERMLDDALQETWIRPILAEAD